MLQSFYTGNTGLGANTFWLSVISDNIANVNTIGYKQEVVNFNDLIANSLTTYTSSGVPINKEVGGGAFIGSTMKDFSQGSFKLSGSPLNLALDGEGFFIVKNPAADMNFYTRDGTFRLDANGDIVTQSGYKVQGWRLDENGNMAGAIGDINIPNALNPRPTTKVTYEPPANLDSSIPVNNATFNKDDSTTYDYVNAMTVYDSLGNQHTMTFYYVHTDNNEWDVHVFLDDGDTELSTNTLTFDSNGNLTGGATQTVNATLDNGAATLDITIDYSKMTQLAADFISYSQQDGYAKGDLMNISVSEDGVVSGTYTNGQVLDLARIAVATFKDKEMMVRKGDNLYVPNQQTYTPIIVPGGVISKVRSGMLEMSNVDISKEFINLITAQRAYQANAKTITTSDQILQTTMDIKR